MPAQFLMQQMEWREAFDDATTVQSVEALLGEVQVSRKHLLQECEHCLDVQHDPATAVTPVRALMFIEKFAQDLNQRLDQFV